MYVDWLVIQWRVWKGCNYLNSVNFWILPWCGMWQFWNYSRTITYFLSVA